jgi:hypothetical protein
MALTSDQMLVRSAVEEARATYGEECLYTQTLKGQLTLATTGDPTTQTNTTAALKATIVPGGRIPKSTVGGKEK